jgi:DnaJ-class molecular chaperone
VSVWADGRLKPGFLCPFCAGSGSFFRLVAERAAWWRCMACGGTGATALQPAEICLGAAQGKHLRPPGFSQTK